MGFVYSQGLKRNKKSEKIRKDKEKRMSSLSKEHSIKVFE
jgi:hypothetical protein